MEYPTIAANEMTFAYIEEGPSDGPLALCLHGFPDSAHTWRHLLPQLAEAGYHAVAPFLRGYAPSQIPADGLYQVGALARDTNDLHEALGGRDDAVLIGHDWGALAAYATVVHQPHRWRRAVTLAVPPVAAVGESFFAFDQLKRSWYTFFFQTALADLALPMDDYAFIDRLWADWSPGYDATWDLQLVKQSIGTPERIVAAISYYRALYDAELHDPSLAAEQAAGSEPTPLPTLYLHGRDDGCFTVDVIGHPLEFMADGSELAIVDDAGHFLQLEQPAVVNALILNFLDQ